MWLNKYNPRSQTNIDQFIDSFFNNFDLEPAKNWKPAADISETDSDYFVNIDVPGLESKDIQISVDNNVLHVTGEREHVKEENEKFYRLERKYGKFERYFNLSDDVKNDKIEAEFKNGQLRIRLPKEEQKQKKRIEINVK